MDFKAELEKLNIKISNKQEEQFFDYYNLLVKWNEVMNLTGITDYDGVYLKHFYDSLTLAKVYDFSQETKLCDIGSGAGFPAIPLKIVFPNLKISIVDSLGKRITFLQEVSKALGLCDISFFHARAEEFAEKKRESFDVVTCRALANIYVANELCLPLVKKDGVFLAMMAKHDIIKDLDNIKGIKILGGKVEKKEAFYLPIEDSERCIIKIRKEALTPAKYPRNFAAIKKAPLM